MPRNDRLLWNYLVATELRPFRELKKLFSVKASVLSTELGPDAEEIYEIIGILCCVWHKTREKCVQPIGTYWSFFSPEYVRSGKNFDEFRSSVQCSIAQIMKAKSHVIGLGQIAYLLESGDGRDMK